MRALVYALVAALGIACGGHSPTATDFEPIRLIGDPGIDRSKPMLSWGTVVVVQDVPRPVISAATPVAPAAEVRTKPEGWRTIRATIPAEMSVVPWVVFETVTTKKGKSKTMRSWPVTSKQAGVAYEVGLVDAAVGDGEPGIRIWPVPDLATRDVETGPIAVPVHARLDAAVALEQITWDTTVAPIDMTVDAVVDGQAQTLDTVRLDARKPENRKWVPVKIPLDAIGGKTVRFRFAARPTLGPTAAVSLPVWGDPTIVPTGEVPPS